MLSNIEGKEGFNVDLYLIRHYKEKYIVEAEDSLKAITAWINEKNREEKEYYNSVRKFKPNEYSIENIGSRKAIIRASE